MSNARDIMCRDALLMRLKGMPGGNRIEWSAKDIVTIRDYVASLPEAIIRAAPTAVRKFDPDPAGVRHKFAEEGVAVRQKMTADDLNFLFPISSGGTDLVNDSVKQVDCSSFNRNPIIPNAHDTAALPVAISSPPWISSGKLMAIANFPQPGVSKASDKVAAAIRASLVRGASIGFVPLKWSFTKDPSRPLGVDFLEVLLLEWSICALPCNPDCILVGAVSGGKSSSAKATAARLLEARAIAAKARSIIARFGEDAPSPTREQRIAEARNFRRLANMMGSKR